MKKLLLGLAFLLLYALSFAQTTVTVPLTGTIISKAQGAVITSTMWSFDSGAGGTIATPAQQSTTATLPVGVFVIRWTVKDNLNNTVYALKKVTVFANAAPVINAGQDTTIQLGSTAFIMNKKIIDLAYKVKGSDILSYKIETLK